MSLNLGEVVPAPLNHVVLLSPLCIVVVVVVAIHLSSVFLKVQVFTVVARKWEQ